MDELNPWEIPLEISKEQLLEWQAEAPPEVPFLIWCLLEEKIPFEVYAHWAMKHYQLPKLRHEYFSNTQSSPVDPDLLDSTPWMVPLGTWENLTYMGCVVPPPDPEENFIYVLAHPKDLMSFYEQISAGTAQEDSEDSIAAEIQPFALEPEMSSPSEEDVPLEKAEEVESEMPQGLVLNLKSDSPPKLPDHAPEGLGLGSFVAPPSEEAPVGIQLNERHLKSAKSQEAPEGLSFPGGDLNLQTPNEETSSQTFEKPAPSQRPSISSEADPDLNSFWVKTQTHFKHCALLKKDSNMVQLFWKDGQAMASGPQLDLTRPSLFRITHRTKKPYFGFAVKNEIHDQFFQIWNQPDYPPSVTALSTVEGDQEILLVFFGFKGEEASEELPTAESLLDEFKGFWPKVSSKAA